MSSGLWWGIIIMCMAFLVVGSAYYEAGYKGVTVTSPVFDIRFNKQYLDIWLSYRKEVYVVISVLLILRHPSSLDVQRDFIDNFMKWNPDIAKLIKESLSK